MSIAVLLAAGSSRRFQSNKLWALLQDKPVIQHSLDRFAQHPEIEQLVVVHSPDDRQRLETMLREYPQKITLVEGGATRCDSTRHALETLNANGVAGTDILLIHDAARPLASADLITQCLKVLQGHPAVCPVAPLVDTVMKHNDEFLLNPLARWQLGACQTPQGFKFALIYTAHQDLQRHPEDKERMTDDCSVVLRHNPQQAIRMVTAPRENIKITHPLDLRFAHLLLEE